MENDTLCKMVTSKCQNFEILTLKISKNRYFFGKTFIQFKIVRNLNKNGKYVIEPDVYYLHAKF